MTKHNSIDGFFIPRRQEGTEGARPGLDSVNKQNSSRTSGGQSLKSRQEAPLRSQASDYFHSTATLTATPPLPLEDHKPRHKEKKKKGFRLHRPSRKTVKRLILILLALILIGAGYFAYKFFVNSGKVFKGNVLSAIFSEGKPLKTDENGRSNILLFGTSEDDPGHEGASLTDSIMVLSVNQKKKDAFMVSIPRDLRVKYGKACNSGYQGKVNELYACYRGYNPPGNEAAGQDALRKKTGEVLGLDVQYAVHVNYTVLRQAVAAVGGITVTIESRDPRGQMDSNFDWKCGVGRLSRAEVIKRCPPNGHFIDYPNGPAQLDAEHALYLAQARGDRAPTYGFEQSNFDREKNQRKIIVALKDKATSAGVLANPVAVNNLLDALGDNVKTNFEADEVKTLIKLGREISSNNIRSLELNSEEKPLMGFCNPDVCPTAGQFVYTQIHSAVKAFANQDAATLEGAKIDVFNASGVAGAAQTKATTLAEAGLAVNQVGNAPTSAGATPIAIYDLSKGKKPATLKKLKTLFGVQSASTTLPSGVTSTADFVIIVGNGTAQNAQ